MPVAVGSEDGSATSDEISGAMGVEFVTGSGERVASAEGCSRMKRPDGIVGFATPTLPRDHLQAGGWKEKGRR